MHLLNFPAFLIREWRRLPFDSLHSKSVWKGVYSKRKEFAPSGEQIFAFLGLTSFYKGDKRMLKELTNVKAYQCPLINLDQVL